MFEDSKLILKLPTGSAPGVNAAVSVSTAAEDAAPAGKTRGEKLRSSEYLLLTFTVYSRPQKSY